MSDEKKTEAAAQEEVLTGKEHKTIAGGVSDNTSAPEPDQTGFQSSAIDAYLFFHKKP